MYGLSAGATAYYNAMKSPWSVPDSEAPLIKRPHKLNRVWPSITKKITKRLVLDKTDFEYSPGNYANNLVVVLDPQAFRNPKDFSSSVANPTDGTGWLVPEQRRNYQLRTYAVLDSAKPFSATVDNPTGIASVNIPDFKPFTSNPTQITDGSTTVTVPSNAVKQTNKTDLYGLSGNVQIADIVACGMRCVYTGRQDAQQGYVGAYASFQTNFTTTDIAQTVYNPANAGATNGPSAYSFHTALQSVDSLLEKSRVNYDITRWTQVSCDPFLVMDEVIDGMVRSKSSDMTSSYFAVGQQDYAQFMGTTDTGGATAYGTTIPTVFNSSTMPYAHLRQWEPSNVFRPTMCLVITTSEPALANWVLEVDMLIEEYYKIDLTDPIFRLSTRSVLPLTDAERLAEKLFDDVFEKKETVEPKNFQDINLADFIKDVGSRMVEAGMVYSGQQAMQAMAQEMRKRGIFV